VLFDYFFSRSILSLSTFHPESGRENAISSSQQIYPLFLSYERLAAWVRYARYCTTDRDFKDLRNGQWSRYDLLSVVAYVHAEVWDILIFRSDEFSSADVISCWIKCDCDREWWIVIMRVGWPCPTWSYCLVIRLERRREIMEICKDRRQPSWIQV
jgi:hypothetical protein